MLHLGFLVTVFALLSVAFLMMKSDEQTMRLAKQSDSPKALFASGQSVILSAAHQQPELQYLEDTVGHIDKVRSITAEDGEVTYSYDVSFTEQVVLKAIPQEWLSQVDVAHRLGDKIKILHYGQLSSDGVIQKITYHPLEKTVSYDAWFDSEGYLSNITVQDIVPRYRVPLKETYTAKENNRVLRDMMHKAAENAYTILDFPKGRFKIGSDKPDKDYLILSSNVELNGNDTTLVVTGTAYWFGLATGEQAAEGLSQFTMRRLTFEAADLVNGNHFMLMANHGHRWLIEDNTFTLVHHSRSHLFDLGGVQDVLFQGNQFIGFAPDLTAVDSLSSQDNWHAFYAEVIQLDASDSTGVWDAGLIKRIDPDYDKHNAIKQFSHQIVIRDNAFLPYKDKQNRIVAYSGSVGQHSSPTGYVEVVNNHFESPLVLRYPESQTHWVLQPIHFPPQSEVYLEGNRINK